MSASVCKLYVEVSSGCGGEGRFRHHIADVQFVVSGNELKSSLAEDLKFDQEAACTLHRLFVDFHGLMLPIELIGAPFDLCASDSQRISYVALSVDT